MAWEPVAMKECSRGCPAVGELFDGLVEQEMRGDFWRMTAILLLLMNVALLARDFGWL